MQVLRVLQGTLARNIEERRCGLILPQEVSPATKMFAGRAAVAQAVSELFPPVAPTSARCTHTLSNFWEAMRILAAALDNFPSCAPALSPSRSYTLPVPRSRPVSSLTSPNATSLAGLQLQQLQRRQFSALPALAEEPAEHSAALTPDLKLTVKAIKTDDEHPCGEGKLEWPFNAKAFYVGEQCTAQVCLELGSTFCQASA